MAHPGVYVITAAVTVIAGLFLYFSASNNRQRAPPHQHSRRNRSNSFVDNDNQCTICLEVIKNEFSKTHLKCGHSFHNECIKKWIRINAICPLCKERTGIDI